MTNYTATHDASDLPAITIDIIVEAGIQILQFIALFVIAFVLVWMARQMKRTGLLK